MRILHYSLGLPPYRSGGLTKYATDLMIAQSSLKDEISLLYPGDFTFWKFPKIKIIRKAKFKDISVFEIQNPAIVPLRHGVKHPKSIFSPKQTLSTEQLEQFYFQTNPDILHIHTLMGLPLELLTFLRDKGVKILFTSHDYYGLCLKVNFINNNGICCDQSDKIKCTICNNDAPCSLFLRLRNSSYILKYKKNIASGVRKLRLKPPVEKKEIWPSQRIANEYAELIKFYFHQFEKIDFLHFNSNVTKEVFESYLGKRRSVVLPISHSNISDNRKRKIIDKKQVRLGFIGSRDAYKGFPLLKEVLLDLQKKGINNWSLHVWGGITGQDLDCDRIIYKGLFTSDEMTQVFDQIDLLIVPSVWKETFSLITLEALSYGVPVLVSKNVGAKDVVRNYAPEFIFEPKKEVVTANLKTILEDTARLKDFNEKICSGEFDYSLHKHVQNITQLYKNLLV